MENRKTDLSTVIAVFATPFFLGMSPIFGKLAFTAGADALSVAALRTIVAITILWTAYALFFRRYIYIYPAGLLGCIVVGTVNGVGSLFYFGGLSALNDASLAQLINGMYLVFALVMSRIGGQKIDRRTLIRVLLALTALTMITTFSETPLNWTGVGFLLANALMFAGTVILSQYVLYEMPAPTVTLYILTTMAIFVSVIWLAVGQPFQPHNVELAGAAIAMAGITTALARLAMFAGVKLFGGTQTAILAITEIGVAVTLGHLAFRENLEGPQWLGVAILGLSILLIRQKDLLPRGFNPNALLVANMASVQFQRIAFHRAFGTQRTDNTEGTMGSITTQEILMIKRMMGAETGGIDPFPIGKVNPADLLPGEMREAQEIELPDELKNQSEE